MQSQIIPVGGYSIDCLMKIEIPEIKLMSWLFLAYFVWQTVSKIQMYSLWNRDIQQISTAIILPYSSCLLAELPNPAPLTRRLWDASPRRSSVQCERCNLLTRAANPKAGSCALYSTGSVKQACGGANPGLCCGCDLISSSRDLSHDKCLQRHIC